MTVHPETPMGGPLPSVTTGPTSAWVGPPAWAGGLTIGESVTGYGPAADAIRAEVDADDAKDTEIKRLRAALRQAAMIADNRAASLKAANQGWTEASRERDAARERGRIAIDGYRRVLERIRERIPAGRHASPDECDALRELARKALEATP